MACSTSIAQLNLNAITSQQHPDEEIERWLAQIDTVTWRMPCETISPFAACCTHKRPHTYGVRHTRPQRHIPTEPCSPMGCKTQLERYRTRLLSSSPTPANIPRFEMWDFFFKRILNYLKKVYFCSPRTRQASPRCSNVRVIFFI